MLKRNHDLMQEKYELYLLRNETLEKGYAEKEALYMKIKSENEVLADQVYSLKRISEDYKQENSLTRSKLQSLEEVAKTSNEQAIALKISRDKFETTSKTL